MAFNKGLISLELGIRGVRFYKKRSNGLQIAQIHSVPIDATFLTLTTTSDADNKLRENEKLIIDLKII